MPPLWPRVQRLLRIAAVLLVCSAGGVIATLLVVVVHERAHADTAVALGFGPATIRLGHGTDAARIGEFLQALDAGAAPRAAAAAARTSVGRAIAPTAAGVALTDVLLVAFWATLRRAVPAPGHSRPPWWAPAVAALSVASTARLTPIAVLLAAATGRGLVGSDEAHLSLSASGFADPRVLAGLFGLVGLVFIGFGIDATERAVPADGDCWPPALLVWSSLFLVSLAMNTVWLPRFGLLLPAITVGR